MTEGVQWLPRWVSRGGQIPQKVDAMTQIDDAGTLAVYLLYGEFYPEACPASHPVGDREEVCLQIPEKSEGHWLACFHHNGSAGLWCDRALCCAAEQGQLQPHHWHWRWCLCLQHWFPRAEGVHPGKICLPLGRGNHHSCAQQCLLQGILQWFSWSFFGKSLNCKTSWRRFPAQIEY